ncbi:hypothetical protein H7344_06165 [Nocardioides deserti]|uniref:Uncharacterized protein n=1 Tax=Nocardioides deserti TaxID=1588644 RepID=A0ABR6U678_9ACTN|nr:hypothetical protein [Nocardioides deserti]
MGACPSREHAGRLRQCAHHSIKRFPEQSEVGLHGRSSRPHQCPRGDP